MRPLLLWSQDRRSLRVFDRRLDGAALLLAPSGPDELRDADSGSTWDRRGCARTGPRAGRCLAAVPVLWDSWFDWRAYHPDTSVYDR